MLDHNQYVKFKNRSKKHMPDTIDSFEFWGRRVGRIGGQIKSKWGEARWYANLDRPSCIYDLINVSEDHRYKWDPSLSTANAVLDFINNVSKFFGILFYVFVIYKLFFYNVAYWVAILKNRDCTSDIVWSADHPSKILFGKKMAMIVHEQNERADEDDTQ